MLTEGNIKDMHGYLIELFENLKWKRGLCIELEKILEEKEKPVLNHIHLNGAGIPNVEDAINFIWDPMIAYLNKIEKNPVTAELYNTKYTSPAKVLQIQKAHWWSTIGSTLEKRNGKIQNGNVRNGAARAPPPAHVERDTHIAERVPVSPAGHWSIQEAEHGGQWSIQEAERALGMTKKRISELREELAQNPSADNYLTNILKRAMLEEYGLQTEIMIHSNHDKIQKDHEVKINRINHMFSGASIFDIKAAVQHKLALVVAEGEKRKHISNLLNAKNKFQHEATEFRYEPKTDIHGLFDKKTYLDKKFIL